MDAKDVNFAIDYLAQLVTKYKLPPKVLVVHRFTTNMLSARRSDQTRSARAGGDQHGRMGPAMAQVRHVRQTCEVTEPVQFTGFKLFFHNDTKKGDALLAPREVLALRPRPMYIQYQ